MKGWLMKFFLYISLLIALIISAGCVVINQNSVPTPTPQIVYVTVQATPSPIIIPLTTSQKSNGDDSWTHVETLQVQAKGPDAPEYKTVPVYSSPLKKGVQYKIQASGTFMYGNSVSWGMADAEWSNRQSIPSSGPAAGMWNPGETTEPYLDLMIDENEVDWGNYQTSHIYTRQITGDGKPLGFRIKDSANIADGEGSYADNSGSLTVDIYEKNAA